MTELNGDHDQPVPGDREVHRHLDAAREALGVGDLDRAEAACSAGLELEADFLPMLEVAGVVACQRGDLETGISRFRWLTELAPDNPGAHFNLGNALLSVGRFRDAIASLSRADELGPENTEIQVALAMARRHAGDLDGAREGLERVLALTPGHLAALNALGATLADLGDFDAATDAFQKALAIEPRSAPLRMNAGQMLLDCARYHDAAEQFRLALTVSTRDADARAGLASALSGMGDFDEAVHHFRRALKHAPGHAQATYGLVDTLEHLGRLDEASSVLDAAIAAAGNDPNLEFLAARLAVRRGDEAGALERLEAMDAVGIPEPMRPRASCELGMLRDRAGREADAMAAFEAANEASAAHWARIAPGPNHFRARVQRVAAAVASGSLDGLPGPGQAPSSPAFVVGFPRSGTTLMGRMLDAHPALVAADEIPALSRMAEDLSTNAEAPYPEALGTMDEAQREGLVERYRNAFPDAGAGRLVDKMPMNLVHVPLVRALFGDPPIVFMIRDPRDVCLSCFMQPFDLNAAMSNFHRLDRTVETYVEVMGLWEQLRERLGLAVHEVRYEALVGDPAGILTATCDAIGVPFDEGMLRFHERKDAATSIRTPSYRQVTEAVSDQAVARWKRYRPWLEPHLEALAPFVDRYGYEAA